MRPLLRLGCAGVAAIAIAALTSIGLYAVVAGQMFTGSAAARPPAGGAPLLVTIQAGPATPTPPPTLTETPMPASLLPAAVSAPAHAAPPPATPVTAAPVAAATPSAAAAAPATPSVPAVPTQPTATPASPSALAAGPSPVSASSPAASAEPAGQATHEQLVVSVLAVEWAWPGTDDTAPRDGRAGPPLVTVLVSATNRARETRFVADADLLLVGADGARYTPRPAGTAREPRLLTMPILPGDTVRGWLTYEAPAGELSTRLQWSPTRPDRPRAEAAYVLSLPR